VIRKKIPLTLPPPLIKASSLIPNTATPVKKRKARCTCLNACHKKYYSFGILGEVYFNVDKYFTALVPSFPD